MKEQRPTDHAAEEHHLIVVEAYNACLCHVLVRARLQTDEARWFFFFVPIHYGVSFGDHLIFLPNATEVTVFLDRGPKLRFRLRLDDIPVALLEKAMSELPWELQPPQGETGETDV